MNDEPINIKCVKATIPVFDSPFSRSASYVVCGGMTYFKVIDGKDIVITKTEYDELFEIIKRRAGC